MADEKVKYPQVTVHLSTGVDSNIGSVMTVVAAAMQAAGLPRGAVNDLWKLIFDSGSYDEALNHIMRTVNVT